MATPKDKLLGRTIGNGWVVKEMLQKVAGQTGGHFSTGYVVERGQERAFLKAMDLTQALLTPPKDQLAAIRFAIDMIDFEGSLLEECRSRNLSRVVRLLEAATVDLAAAAGDPLAAATSRVHVFIFELGGSDVRRNFGVPTATDASQRLRVLHSIAVGIHQLHSIGVAHQDIKPSNVLSFSTGHKLTDLGRSTRQGKAGPFDGLIFPGDLTYSPPEFAYGHTPPDYVDRRYAADAYMLGSMIAFMFTMQSTTTLLQQSLSDDVLPPIWRRSGAVPPWAGSFEDALPYLVQSFERVRSYVEGHIPESIRSDLGQVYAQLSHPSPYLRGHPKSRAQAGRPVGIDRFISVLDRLSLRVGISERVQKKTA